MAGRKAAMLFPSRISPSVVGAARRGSRLFSTFSPTMLYEAIGVGMIAGMMTKKKVNEFNSPGRDAAGIPPLFLPAVSRTNGKSIEIRRRRSTTV
jgi:hypothetical protein